MPELISQAAYARHQDVAPQTIGAWKKAGRIVMVGRKVDVKASDEMLAATEDPGNKMGAEERYGKKKGISEDATSFQKSRAEFEALKVKKARLEYDQLAGALVSRGTAEKQAFENGRRFRDCIMSLPDSYADRLAAITNVREMREALRVMLKDAIAGISDD